MTSFTRILIIGVCNNNVAVAMLITFSNLIASSAHLINSVALIIKMLGTEVQTTDQKTLYHALTGLVLVLYY
jgi:hypothetical protein